MATSEQYVAAQNGAVRLALKALRDFLASLDMSDAIAVRDALERFWPALLEQFGEVTATLAADRFEELTGLPATMVRPVDPDRANARMRWALGPLFGDDGDAQARLDLLTDELVKQPGRSTMVASARDNKVRYARVPTGSETCSFCLMLASRGFIYHSDRRAADMPKAHGACDCRIAVEGEDVGGYDPDALYARWQDSLAAEKSAT